MSGDVAVELLRRPFFPGEESPWISARRAELDELLYRALSVSAEVHTTRGMHPEGRRYARRMIKLDPYRESGHAWLVRSLLAGGDRVSALQAYEDARTLFVEELGVPPSELLETAYREALAADPEAPGDPAAPLPTGIVALLFTDLVGSVALSERLGPHGDELMRQDHFGLLRDAIEAHDGHEVKNLGDGLMVAFSSSCDAVDAAVAIQQRIAERAATGAEELQIRIGIHVGEPVLDGHDYFGKPVAVARRLCDAADGHEILVSELVRGLSRSPEIFTERREITLKGMADETVTWKVDWRDHGL